MTVEEGLRARKQRETRAAIHRAAVGLALEHSPDAATVAEICDRANVSERTFFNYYPGKEDAFIGLHDGLPSTAELDEFRSGTSDDLLGDTFQLLLAVFSPSNDGLMLQRRALVTAHPELLQRQWARLIGVEKRVADVVADRMRASGAFEHLSDIPSAARVLVTTCSGVLRLSIREAVDLGSYPTDIERHIDDTLHTLRELLRTLL